MCLTTNFAGNALGLSLAAFHAMCAQAHITDALTPSFARTVADSIGPLNSKAYWFLHVSDSAFNHVLLGINLLIFGTLARRKTRKTGCALAAFFLCCGL